MYRNSVVSQQNQAPPVNVVTVTAKATERTRFILCVKPEIGIVTPVSAGVEKIFVGAIGFNTRRDSIGLASARN